MWNEISIGGWDGRGRAPSYTFIRDPRFQTIFYMLSLAITNRKSGVDKVHKDEMFWLGCKYRKELCNVPHIMANWMVTVLKGG